MNANYTTWNYIIGVFVDDAKMYKFYSYAFEQTFNK